MAKKSNFLIKYLIVMLFMMLFITYLNILNNHEKYYVTYLEKTNDIITFGDAPRGNIYDINNKLLVSNKEILNLGYNHIKGTSMIDISYTLSEYLDYEFDNDLILKDFYYATNDNLMNKYLTKTEIKKYENRKLSYNEVKNLIYERIPDSELAKVNKNASYIYYLMNQNSKYDIKILKENLDLDTLNNLLALNIPGLKKYSTYERVYHYDTSLNSIFGSVGHIQYDDKAYYQNLGYELNDLVGTSYLEKYYENYLRGTKAVYQILDNGDLELITPAKKGNDLVLNIDIDLQMDTENILKDQIVKLKKLANTEYYTGSFIVISNPEGEIKTMTGYQLLNDNLNEPIFANQIRDIFNRSFTVGSVIKGASQTVAYQNNVIERGKKIQDSCVKLAHIKEKCSFKRLGYIDDVDAIKWSSNYYQFINAIKVTGNTYKNNMELVVSEDDFLKYRRTFMEYGLNNSTGIDAEEKMGITGKKITGDLLLNLSIGQYDTYTILGLTNYINTLSNYGNRYALKIVNKIVLNEGEISTKELLNQVNINSDDMNRIRLGLRKVLDGGTGRGYINNSYLPAGKTGTSESFIDTDNDGVIDTKTITETSAMYYPSDNPIYTITIVSPNSGHYNTKNDYLAPINSRISKEVTKNMFENY